MRAQPPQGPKTKARIKGGGGVFLVKGKNENFPRHYISGEKGENADYFIKTLREGVPKNNGAKRKKGG